MSYILEALKKAQAERQLGNAPTIHAPQPVQASAATGDGLSGSRKPLLLGVGAGVIVAAVGAALLWHRAPAPAVQVAQAPSALTSPTPAPVSGQAVAPTSAAGGASATLAVRAPDTLSAPPAAVPRVPESRPATPPVRTAAAPGAGSAGRASPAAAPFPVQAQAAPAPAAPAPASEDSLPMLQQLPESIRAQIPRVNFGGYMYSANPADRLVLVDKGLRHEGEEVGPGLVLEKLLPHAAVMNFRGVRYRVAY
jgi:general secretion pathway protein B